VVEGRVRNMTDFGAFIDLDGMDGLLHITDMTWGRLGHPSELLKVGQELEVVVLDINKEKERVSLGLKQTQKNPWDQIEERFPAGQVLWVSPANTRSVRALEKTFSGSQITPIAIQKGQILDLGSWAGC
jgi:ribosomal protein S1